MSRFHLEGKLRQKFKSKTFIQQHLNAYILRTCTSIKCYTTKITAIVLDTGIVYAIIKTPTNGFKRRNGIPAVIKSCIVTTQ